MFAFAELIVNCDQQYCANVNLISLELWGFLARPLCKALSGFVVFAAS